MFKRILFCTCLMQVLAFNTAQAQQADDEAKINVPALPLHVLGDNRQTDEEIAAEVLQVLADKEDPKPFLSPESLKPISVEDAENGINQAEQEQTNVGSVDDLDEKNSSPENLVSRTHIEAGDSQVSGQIEQPQFITEMEIQEKVPNMVQLSLNQTNRLVTPFANPELYPQINDLEFNIEGSVLYVSPKGEGPYTVYIRDEGREDVVVPLVLISGNIPPRNLTLHLKGRGRVRPVSKKETVSLVSDMEYMQLIKEAFKSLAKKQVPTGFTLNSGIERSQRPFHLATQDIRVNFANGQFLSGAEVDIIIGTVENDGAQTVQLDETWFNENNRTAAVAFWPYVSLHPKQATEVYVAVRRRADVTEYTDRPSLVE